MGRFVLVVLIAAAGCFAALRTGSAYTTLPAYKLPTPQFTVSCGNAELTAAAQQWDSVSDLQFLGCAEDPTVELVVIDPWPHPDRGGQTVLVSATKRRIEIRPEYEHDATVMLHEMGHALGLGHSVEAGTRVVGNSGPAGAVMHWNPCNKVPGAPGPNVGPCNTMNADDIAGIRALYGPFPEVPTATATATRTATMTATAAATKTPQPSATSQPSPIPTATQQPPVAPPVVPPQLRPYRVFLPGLVR